MKTVINRPPQSHVSAVTNRTVWVVNGGLGSIRFIFTSFVSCVLIVITIGERSMFFACFDLYRGLWPSYNAFWYWYEEHRIAQLNGSKDAGSAGRIEYPHKICVVELVAI